MQPWCFCFQAVVREDQAYFDEPPYADIREEKGEENVAFQYPPTSAPPPAAAAPLSGTPPLSASSPVSGSHQGFSTVPLSPGASPTAPYFGTNERQPSERVDPTYSHVHLHSPHTDATNRDPPYHEHDAWTPRHGTVGHMRKYISKNLQSYLPF